MRRLTLIRQSARRRMPKPGLDAVQQATRLLARREHSRHELRGKLRACGHTAEAIEAALEALRGQGMQSDRRFAEACARSLAERGYGSRRVGHELRRRGVASELAGELERQARHQDLTQAVAALQRKTRARPLERMPLLRFLASRGYPEAVAVQATDAWLRGGRA